MIFELLNQKNLQGIATLLEQDSDILKQTTSSGNTPLHVAAKLDTSEFIASLLDSGLDFDINARGVDDFTPLLYAVSSQNGTITKLLLEHGADVHKASKEGNSPIMTSVMRYNGDNQVTKLLLEHGADPNTPNRHGITLFKLLDMPKNKDLKPLFSQ